eukprot:3816807-Pleurochrysis_carterae.AAC.1
MDGIDTAWWQMITNTCASMLEFAGNLILELAPPDGLTAPSCASWIASLNHEVLDDPMERYSIVIASLSSAYETVVQSDQSAGLAALQEHASYLTKTLQLACLILPCKAKGGEARGFM